MFLKFRSKSFGTGTRDKSQGLWACCYYACAECLVNTALARQTPACWPHWTFCSRSVAVSALPHYPTALPRSPKHTSFPLPRVRQTTRFIRQSVTESNDLSAGLGTMGLRYPFPNNPAFLTPRLLWIWWRFWGREETRLMWLNEALRVNS